MHFWRQNKPSKKNLAGSIVQVLFKTERYWDNVSGKITEHSCKGLKIPRWLSNVPVRVRPPAVCLPLTPLN